MKIFIIFCLEVVINPETVPFLILHSQVSIKQASLLNSTEYSDVSIKNIDILPNRQYIANTADSAQEQYS